MSTSEWPRPDYAELSASVRRVHVLIADDEDVQRVAMRLLAEEGAMPTAVQSAASLILRVVRRTTRVDVVLCDAGFPKLDLAQLRRAIGDWSPRTRIVVTSWNAAHRRDAERVQASFRAKPFDAHAPLSCIAMAARTEA